MDNSGVLNSWKEISNYVGRGVRTVQRWERDFGLPVRRPAGHMKSAVVALRSDIDQWLTSRRIRELDKKAPPSAMVLDLSRVERLAENIRLLQKNLEILKREHERLLAMRSVSLMERAPNRSVTNESAA